MKTQRFKADLVIRNIGQLLTIRGHSSSPIIRPDLSSLGIVSGRSCIASSLGKICFVGKESGLPNVVDATRAREINAKGKLVLPGFIDSHTHAIFAGSREGEIGYKLRGLSYIQILKKGGGILKTVEETRKASMEELVSQTRGRLDRMISYGTTTIEIKSGYGLSVKAEIKLLETLGKLKRDFGYDIVPTLLSAHALPKEYHRTRDFINEVVFPTIDFASTRRLATFCDVFMEKGVFGAEESRLILHYARDRGLQLKIHADEFSDIGGALLASRMKVTSADHLLKTSRRGIRSLAKSQTMSVLLPGTSLASFAPNFANARDLIDAGAPVALGTDLSPNSWIESMQFVTSLACYSMKMTPAEAIVGSTINAAHAVGRSSEIGSIENGKSCDALVTSVNKFEEIPYRIASNCITHVVKNGSLVKQNQI